VAHDSDKPMSNNRKTTHGSVSNGLYGELDIGDLSVLPLPSFTQVLRSMPLSQQIDGTYSLLNCLFSVAKRVVWASVSKLSNTLIEKEFEDYIADQILKSDHGCLLFPPISGFPLVLRWGSITLCTCDPVCVPPAFIQATVTAGDGNSSTVLDFLVWQWLTLYFNSLNHEVIRETEDYLINCVRYSEECGSEALLANRMRLIKLEPIVTNQADFLNPVMDVTDPCHNHTNQSMDACQVEKQVTMSHKYVMLHSASNAFIDARPHLGGQPNALYPNNNTQKSTASTVRTPATDTIIMLSEPPPLIVAKQQQQQSLLNQSYSVDSSIAYLKVAALFNYARFICSKLHYIQVCCGNSTTLYKQLSNPKHHDLSWMVKYSASYILTFGLDGFDQSNYTTTLTEPMAINVITANNAFNHVISLVQLSDDPVSMDAMASCAADTKRHDSIRTMNSSPVENYYELYALASNESISYFRCNTQESRLPFGLNTDRVLVTGLLYISNFAHTIPASGLNNANVLASKEVLILARYTFRLNLLEIMDRLLYPKSINHQPNSKPRQSVPCDQPLSTSTAALNNGRATADFQEHIPSDRLLRLPRSGNIKTCVRQRIINSNLNWREKYTALLNDYSYIKVIAPSLSDTTENTHLKTPKWATIHASHTKLYMSLSACDQALNAHLLGPVSANSWSFNMAIQRLNCHYTPLYVKVNTASRLQLLRKTLTITSLAWWETYLQTIWRKLITAALSNTHNITCPDQTRESVMVFFELLSKHMGLLTQSNYVDVSLLRPQFNVLSQLFAQDYVFSLCFQSATQRSNYHNTQDGTDNVNIKIRPMVTIPAAITQSDNTLTETTRTISLMGLIHKTSDAMCPTSLDDPGHVLDNQFLDQIYYPAVKRATLKELMTATKANPEPAVWLTTIVDVASPDDEHVQTVHRRSIHSTICLRRQGDIQPRQHIYNFLMNYITKDFGLLEGKETAENPRYSLFAYTEYSTKLNLYYDILGTMAMTPGLHSLYFVEKLLNYVFNCADMSEHAISHRVTTLTNMPHMNIPMANRHVKSTSSSVTWLVRSNVNYLLQFYTAQILNNNITGAVDADANSVMSTLSDIGATRGGETEGVNFCGTNDAVSDCVITDDLESETESESRIEPRQGPEHESTYQNQSSATEAKQGGGNTFHSREALMFDSSELKSNNVTHNMYMVPNYWVLTPYSNKITWTMVDDAFSAVKKQLSLLSDVAKRVDEANWSNKRAKRSHNSDNRQRPEPRANYTKPSLAEYIGNHGVAVFDDIISKLGSKSMSFIYEVDICSTKASQSAAVSQGPPSRAVSVPLVISSAPESSLIQNHNIKVLCQCKRCHIMSIFIKKNSFGVWHDLYDANARKSYTMHLHGILQIYKGSVTRYQRKQSEFSKTEYNVGCQDQTESPCDQEVEEVTKTLAFVNTMQNTHFGVVPVSGRAASTINDSISSYFQRSSDACSKLSALHDELYTSSPIIKCLLNFIASNPNIVDVLELFPNMLYYNEAEHSHSLAEIIIQLMISKQFIHNALVPMVYKLPQIFIDSTKTVHTEARNSHNISSETLVRPETNTSTGDIQLQTPLDDSMNTESINDAEDPIWYGGYQIIYYDHLSIETAVQSKPDMQINDDNNANCAHAAAPISSVFPETPEYVVFNQFSPEISYTSDGLEEQADIPEISDVLPKHTHIMYSRRQDLIKLPLPLLTGGGKVDSPSPIQIVSDKGIINKSQCFKKVNYMEGQFINYDAFVAAVDYDQQKLNDSGFTDMFVHKIILNLAEMSENPLHEIFAAYVTSLTHDDNDDDDNIHQGQHTHIHLMQAAVRAVKRHPCLQFVINLLEWMHSLELNSANPEILYNMSKYYGIGHKHHINCDTFDATLKEDRENEASQFYYYFQKDRMEFLNRSTGTLSNHALVLRAYFCIGPSIQEVIELYETAHAKKLSSVQGTVIISQLLAAIIFTLVPQLRKGLIRSISSASNPSVTTATATATATTTTTATATATTTKQCGTFVAPSANHPCQSNTERTSIYLHWKNNWDNLDVACNNVICTDPVITAGQEASEVNLPRDLYKTPLKTKILVGDLETKRLTSVLFQHICNSLDISFSCLNLSLDDQQPTRTTAKPSTNQHFKPVIFAQTANSSEPTRKRKLSAPQTNDGCSSRKTPHRRTSCSLKYNAQSGADSVTRFYNILSEHVLGYTDSELRVMNSLSIETIMTHLHFCGLTLYNERHTVLDTQIVDQILHSGSRLNCDLQAHGFNNLNDIANTVEEIMIAPAYVRWADWKILPPCLEHNILPSECVMANLTNCVQPFLF